MRSYIGFIHKDADSDFGVSFPDFPGVVTAGTTLDDARIMAEEALALHIEGLTEDGEAVPAPSSLEEVMSDPDNRSGVAILVSVKTEQPRAVRVNVTLPGDVLEQIDKYAEAHGFTRSGFLNSSCQETHGRGRMRSKPDTPHFRELSSPELPVVRKQLQRRVVARRHHPGQRPPEYRICQRRGMARIEIDGIESMPHMQLRIIVQAAAAKPFVPVADAPTRSCPGPRSDRDAARLRRRSRNPHTPRTASRLAPCIG